MSCFFHFPGEPRCDPTELNGRPPFDDEPKHYTDLSLSVCFGYWEIPCAPPYDCGRLWEAARTVSITS